MDPVQERALDEVTFVVLTDEHGEPVAVFEDGSWGYWVPPLSRL